MSNTNIKLKKSSVSGRIPSVGDLDYGELAINYADGKVYYKNSSNQIKGFIDSAGVQSLINSVSIDSVSEATNALLLNNEDAAYYLNYNNFTNTPNVLDSADVLAISTANLSTDSGVTTQIILNVVDSDYVQLRSNGLDSDQVVSLIPDAAYRGLRKYNYVATEGQSAFSDSDALGEVLTFSHNSNLAVYLNGILLADSDDFTATNDTITLTAPAVADDVLTVHNIQAGGLDSASVIELNNRLGRVGINETVFTAIAGQDTFNTDYVPGALLVTLNGIILLNGEDYVATNGNSIVFDEPADSGDTVIIATFGGDSANVYTIVDSDYVQLRAIGLDYNLLSNRPTIVDSAATASNALALGGEVPSYYLNYNNFANTPNVLDSTNIESIVTSYGYSTFDSAEAIQLITSYGYSTFDSADATGVIEAYGYSTFDSTSFGTEFDAKSTSDLSEGTNLYYTTARHDSDFDARLSAGTGVTVSSGQVSIGQAVGTADSVTFSGMTIAGDLFVTGTTTEANTVVYTIQDPLLHLADSNEVSDTVDIGFIGHYSDDGGVSKRHTGFFRDASNSQYYLFNGLIDAGFDSTLPINTVDRNGTDFELAALNVSTIAGQYLGFDSDFNLKTVSDLPNDANYLDSTTVQGVIDASYIQSNQITYSVLDSADVSLIISNTDLIDSADVSAIISNIDFVDSADVATIISNTDLVDSADVALIITSQVDSAYVQSRQQTFDFLDSAEVINLVDSDYVEQRRPAEAIFDVVNNGFSAYSFTGDGFPSSQDNPTLYLQRGLTYKFNINAVSHPFEIRVGDGGSAYNTGVTNNTQNNGELIFNVPMNAPNTLVYQCTVHSGMIGNIVLLDDNFFLDSAGIISLISNQGYLTEALDSSQVLNLIDSDYIQARQIVGGSGGTDSATVISLISSTVDSDYVQARQSAGGGGTGTVDSAYVLSVLSGANQAGASDFLFTADSGQTVFTGLDNNSDSLSFLSTSVQVFLNGILLRQDQDFVDSGNDTITLTEGADSGDELTVFNIVSSGAGTDSAAIIQLIDSDYVNARVVIPEAGLDSAAVLAVVATSNRAGVDTFEFVADSAADSVSGADLSGNTLSYNAGGVVVYVNGILLRDQDYTAVNGTSISFDTALDSGDEVTVLSIIAGTTLGGTLSNYTYQADSAETVFSGSDIFGNTLEYATDKVQVYLNGILLIDSVDFAANDGSSIVLTSATDSNDYVSIIAGLEGPASTWREVDESSYTAVANSKLIVDTSTGVVTVTLPGSPEFGDEVKIIDGTGNADSNNITINRNGNKILGADSDFTLDVNRVAVDLVYYNTAQGWIISGNS